MLMSYLEIFSIIFFLGAFGLLGMTYLKKVRLEQDERSSLKESDILKMKAEEERKKETIFRVDHFLKHAQFIDLVGSLGELKIYNYIFNSGYLYQFDEVMSDKDNKIGIDENLLCFKKLCYKRVNNPKKFLEKFGHELEIPSAEIRVKVVM